MTRTVSLYTRFSLRDVIANVLVVLVALLALTGMLIAQNPVPLINQPLVPDAKSPGGTGFTLTVHGTGFVPGAVVKWSGRARSTAFVSRSRLTANIPASDIASAGTASVTVVNPGPGGGASNVAFFEVMSPGPSVQFSAPSHLNAGFEPIEAVAGDFNGDGLLDLAVANEGSNNVSVLLGKGDGTFQRAVNYAAGSGQLSVALGDFNSDGKLDLAIAGAGLGILLGNGDGTFKPVVAYTAGPGPDCVAVGDLNGDGKLDVVLTDSSGGVAVRMGKGDGTFGPMSNFAAGDSPQSVAVGDFNGDGKLDLAVANELSNDVSILLGKGNGTFGSAVSYSVGTFPIAVAVADLNHDGKLDIVVANSGGNDVSVLLGNGNGTFQPAVAYAAGSTPISVIVEDFNHDGKLDLAVQNESSNAISLFLGKGDGTFEQAVSFDAGINPTWATVGDFNRDGALDLASINHGGTGMGVSILLQQPFVTLSPSSLDFGVQLLQTVKAKPITLINTGSTVLNLSTISVAGSSGGQFKQINNCSASILPGKGCTITVTLRPAHLGILTDSVSIVDNAPDTPQIALSGIGAIAGPNATLSTNNLTFATQLVGTASQAQTITLSNYGTGTLVISGIAMSGANPSAFSESNDCGSSLSPGAACTINVTFRPHQRGSRTATLVLSDNAPGSPQLVAVNGTGTVVELIPHGFNFGLVRVGQTKTLITTLTNTGSTALSIGSIIATPKPPFSEANNCGLSVAAGKSCKIYVTFAPQRTGRPTGAVWVSDNGGGSPQQVSLSGKAIASMLSASAMRSAIAGHETVVVPAPTGHSRVGTRVLDVIDPDREDPFLGDGTKREVLVRLWYPASVSAGCQLAEYAPAAVWNHFSRLAGLSLPEVRTNSCQDATVAEGTHPVVLFSPGYTGTFTDYTFIFEDLASRGYVVAAINHTYEATAVEFPDDRFVTSVLGSHFDIETLSTDQESLSLATLVRLADVKFVADELGRVNADAGSPFARKLDINRLAVAGHSLGGLAALLSVQQNSPFRTAIVLDGDIPSALLKPTKAAVMILSAGREQWSPGECSLWADHEGPRIAVNLVGAEHLTPSDAVWLAEGGVKTGTMGSQKTVAAIRDYIAAFLDANLRSEPLNPLLTGPSSQYPDAMVTTGEQPLCRKP